MNLQEQIKKDMVAAMKAKETVELSFLRVISGELSTNAKKKEKDKKTEQQILRTMSKNAEDTKKIDELVGNFEIRILDRYIVKVEMYSENHIRIAITDMININGYSGMKDIGKVMQEIKHPQVDNKIASAVARELLT